MTFDELEKEYERTGDQNETDFDKEKYEACKKEIEKSKNKIEERLKSDLEKNKEEKSKLLCEAYTSIMSLCEIALKADSAFTLLHLDFLIPRLKEEGKDEWIKKLEDLRKAGEEQRNKGAVRYVMGLWDRFTVSSSKRRLEELPEILADVDRLRDDFNKLYEKDYPQLQWCLEKLHNIIRTFERDFRSATKGARDGEVMGITGHVGAVAGLTGLAGLVLAPFTFGASLAVAGAASGIGAASAVAVAAGGGIYGAIKSSEKQRQMTQLKQDIEAEVKEFQNIINPMSEKMRDINERIEEILKDLDKLEIEASDVSEYFASTSGRRNIRREDMIAVTAQTSITMSLIGKIEGIFPTVWHLLDLGVLENTRALDDMDYQAKRDMNEQIDESKMTSKAGRFIVGMRKAVHQLQNILEEIKKTKDAMTNFYNTTRQTKQ